MSDRIRIYACDVIADKEMELAPPQKVGKLLVTCRAPFTARKTRAALRNAVFPARITRPGFRSVFIVEADGEALELARQVLPRLRSHYRPGDRCVGQVESKLESIKEAAVKIGIQQIAPKESFCFRLFKRGLHKLQRQALKWVHACFYSGFQQKSPKN